MPTSGGGAGGTPDLLPVAEARSRILAGLTPGAAETSPLAEAIGRVLAADLAARLSLPADPVSAMDGYAARSEDCAAAGSR